MIKSLSEGPLKVLTELIPEKKISFCETFAQIRIMRMRKMRKCEGDFYDANLSHRIRIFSQNAKIAMRIYIPAYVQYHN